LPNAPQKQKKEKKKMESDFSFSFFFYKMTNQNFSYLGDLKVEISGRKLLGSGTVCDWRVRRDWGFEF
jgi:hypothetical protein